MLVKIGNKIYSPGHEPIMVLLTPEDKKNLAETDPTKPTNYCSYPDTMSEEDIKKFMNVDGIAGKLKANSGVPDNGGPQS